jgi:hypothetical protein
MEDEAVFQTTARTGRNQCGPMIESGVQVKFEER